MKIKDIKQLQVRINLCGYSREWGIWKRKSVKACVFVQTFKLIKVTFASMKTAKASENFVQFLKVIFLFYLFAEATSIRLQR